jgi:hypothetical protein
MSAITLSLSGDICIVCNTKCPNRRTSRNYLTRHHIFPTCIANHIHGGYQQKKHDMVSLCRFCHDLYEEKALELKKEILQEMNFPEEKRYYLVPNEKKILKIKQACILLFYHKSKIPSDVCKKLEDKIRKYYGIYDPNDSIPNHIFLRGLNLKALHKKEISIGKIIASGLKTTEEIEFMAQRWRNHFFISIREMKKNRFTESYNPNKSYQLSCGIL